MIRGGRKNLLRTARSLANTDTGASRKLPPSTQLPTPTTARGGTGANTLTRCRALFADPVAWFNNCGLRRADQLPLKQ